MPADVMDPMYWLGEGGLFGGAVLAGVMVIVFIETGLLFPFLPGDTLLFSAGLIAAQPNSPVAIRSWRPAPRWRRCWAANAGTSSGGGSARHYSRRKMRASSNSDI